MCLLHVFRGICRAPLPLVSKHVARLELSRVRQFQIAENAITHDERDALEHDSLPVRRERATDQIGDPGLGHAGSPNKGRWTTTGLRGVKLNIPIDSCPPADSPPPRSLSVRACQRG